MTGRYVVLVAGSRTRSEVNRERVHRELDALLVEHTSQGRKLVIRHGACPTGADEYASEWVGLHQDEGAVEERYPADWTGPCRATCKPNHRKRGAHGHTYCPGAGPYRNRTMLADGVDEVRAFPLGVSHGTYDCVTAARKARIPVVFPREVLERVS